MGQILSQWATQLGAMVIGTAGGDATARKADQSGCVEVIRYRGARARDVAARVMEITHGEGVDVAYDGVGRDSFDGSLASLAFGGQLVMYGQSSGPVAPLEIARLAARSNSVSRPMVFHFVKKARSAMRWQRVCSRRCAKAFPHGRAAGVCAGRCGSRPSRAGGAWRTAADSARALRAVGLCLL